MLASAPPRRAVLLRHHTPDGRWHLDWLLERPPPRSGLQDDDPTLLSFRIEPDTGDPRVPRAFEADAMPDHRRLYLTFEGPLSDGRGRVEQLATGRVQWIRHEPAAVVLLVAWGGAPDADAITWQAMPIDTGPAWRFTPLALAGR